MSEPAFKYLDEFDPKCWSMHTFGTDSKCDMLLNNITETFNSWIKDAREMLLLTMLKLIRRQLMNQFVTKRAGIEKANWNICPHIREKLEKQI